MQCVQMEQRLRISYVVCQLLLKILFYKRTDLFVNDCKWGNSYFEQRQNQHCFENLVPPYVWSTFYRVTSFGMLGFALFGKKKKKSPVDCTWKKISPCGFIVKNDFVFHSVTTSKNVRVVSPAASDWENLGKPESCSEIGWSHGSHSWVYS